METAPSSRSKVRFDCWPTRPGWRCKSNLKSIELEIKAIEQELSKSQLSSSNLEIVVKKGITISKKASQLWVSSDYSDKQRLQYLIYSDGILYNKENNTLRTPRVNSIFAAISYLSYISAENKNGQPTQVDQSSRWVELTGLSSNFWEDVELLVNL